MPEPITMSCNITYSATEVFRYNLTDRNETWHGIVPVFTMLGSEPFSEVYLSCLKSIEHPDNSPGAVGGSAVLEISNVVYVLGLFVASLLLY